MTASRIGGQELAYRRIRDGTGRPIPEHVSSKKWPSSTHVESACRDRLETAGVPHIGAPSRFILVEADNFTFVPDDSVDLVLTDPPFNIARDTNFHTYEKNTINSYRFDGDKGWDTHTSDQFIALLRQWAAEFHRVLRRGGSFAVFCADEYLSHTHNALSDAGLNVRRTLTWRKPNAVPINRKAMMMSACEYLLVGVKGSKATFNVDLPTADWQPTDSVERVLVADKVATLVEKHVRAAIADVATSGSARPEQIVAAVHTALAAAQPDITNKVLSMYARDDNDEPYLRGCVPNVVTFPSKGGHRLHPTEKPTTLLRYLVQLLSRPGDVVLDPFSGSGSCGEACLREGRFVVLTEMDSEYYGKTVARLRKLAPGEDEPLP